MPMTGRSPTKLTVADSVGTGVPGWFSWRFVLGWLKQDMETGVQGI
jgi:hypothetical protein